MKDVNILIGLSGVGKSTVLEEAQLISGTGYDIINFGDRMLEIAREQDYAEDRDEIKELDSETQKKIQQKAAESIVEDARKGEVIVNTHAAIRTPQGYLPGLPKWTVENLEPSKIIMIDAEPEELYRRVEEDDDRDREHDGPEDIREYREIAMNMASTGAVLTGAYFSVIENPEGEAQVAAEELVEVLEN
ncbi:MAG: adenylate kinase [Candidatus Nanohaloarchaea archaeon]